MSRYAMCRRRGSKPPWWTLGKPGPGEWRPIYTLDGKYMGHRFMPYPPGSNRWQGRWRKIPSSTWIYTAALTAAYILYLADPLPGEYEADACWWDDVQQVSDWSEPQELTIP